MVGQQANAMPYQGAYAATLHAGETGRFSFPEVAMMDQQQVRASRHRRVDGRLAGGDAGDQPVNLIARLHLQAVGAVIRVAGAIQKLVTVIDHLTQPHQDRHSFPQVAGTLY